MVYLHGQAVPFCDGDDWLDATDAGIVPIKFAVISESKETTCTMIMDMDILPTNVLDLILTVRTLTVYLYLDYTFINHHATFIMALTC